MIRLREVAESIGSRLTIDDKLIFLRNFNVAINNCVNTSMVWPMFGYWLLADPENGSISLAQNVHRETISMAARLYLKHIDGYQVKKDQWMKVLSDARHLEFSAFTACAAIMYDKTYAACYLADAAADTPKFQQRRVAQAAYLLELIKSHARV